MGKVVGRFYDEAGSPTPLQQRAEEAAAAAKAAAEEQERGGGGGDAGVPCNVKWSRAEGGARARRRGQQQQGWRPEFLQLKWVANLPSRAGHLLQRLSLWQLLTGCSATCWAGD